MGWDNVGYNKAAPDDILITDAQVREIRRLHEKIDGVPAGTYAENTWHMERIEASQYIKKLRRKAGEPESSPMP